MPHFTTLTGDCSTSKIGSWFGLAVMHGLNQRSYSTLGPVSAWMGDCLKTGKQPQDRTKHPGLLSLSQPSL